MVRASLCDATEVAEGFSPRAIIFETIQIPEQLYIRLRRLAEQEKTEPAQFIERWLIHGKVSTETWRSVHEWYEMRRDEEMDTELLLVPVQIFA